MIQLMEESKRTNKAYLIKTILGNTCILAAGIAIAMIYKAEIYFSAVNFLDTFRMTQLLFFLIASLWTSGCFKDFGIAFALLFKKAACPQQLAHAVLAVSTAQKALFFGSALIGIIRLILVFGEPEFENCISALPINLAEFFVTIFYGVLGVLLLEPVKSRLKKKQVDI